MVEIRGSMKIAYMIAAEAPKLVKTFQQIKTAVKDTTIELSTGGSLALTVQDDETKKPMPNMPVQLAAELGGKPNQSFFRLSGPTNEQGGLTVSPVPQLPIELVINHPDYDLFDENYKVGASENKTLTVLLKKRITLEGTVVAAADGKPIEGATVKVAEGTAPNVSEMLGLNDKQVAKAKTDATGHFKVEKCPVGTLYIDASHPDFVLSSKGPEESDQLAKAPITFKLDRNASIHGQVVDVDEKPVEGASIVTIFAQNPFFEQQLAEERPKAPKSGPDGSFVLPSVVPNVEWKIYTLHPDYLQSVSEVVKLRPGEQRDGYVIRLARGGTVSGTVMDSAGNPLKDAEIVAVLASNTAKGPSTRSAPSKSADDGTFSISALNPVST
jgi:protocatechuate 3,4-dioxygenase beta subunit